MIINLNYSAMKTLKITLAIIVMLFFLSSNCLRAQTYQFEWNVPVASGTAWCLEHNIAGSWTYHVIIHVNPQTGIVKPTFHTEVKLT